MKTDNCPEPTGPIRSERPSSNNIFDQFGNRLPKPNTQLPVSGETLPDDEFYENVPSQG